MAQFTIDIDDEILNSIESYIRTQHRVERDEETGMPKLVQIYANAQDFVEKAIAQVLAGVTQQFPTPAMRQHLVAKRQAEIAIQSAVRPKLKRV